jgi:hypothetical protein
VTHNELLDTIGHWNWIEPGAINALRAVVELHKPWLGTMTSKLYCTHCENVTDSSIEYPCPTIQAIEKELG